MVASKPSADGLVFSRGFVGSRLRVWVLCEEEDNVAPHARLLQYKDGSWIFRRIRWGAAALCGTMSPAVEVFVIGVEGEVLRGTSTGFSEEQIDPSAGGPRSRGYFRDAKLIDHVVFVVGMCRQAYRRGAAGNWLRIDRGLLAEPGAMTGLNSIDGLGVDDLYAVGLQGEIWRSSRGQWLRLDSPTNLTLNRILCVSPDCIYACGAGGTLLRGSDDRFVVIDHDATDENLYGLAYYQGALFVAGLKRLYRLVGDDLRPVEINLGPDLTFGHLHANDGVLWSFGARHLAFTDDGTNWSQVFYTG